jgi:hypothetical protein
MIDLKTYAWQTVRALERTNDHLPTIATMAVNQVCTVVEAERGRAHLAKVRAAVDWALDHKDAASLPTGTVVATTDVAYIKEDPETVTTLYSAPGTEPRPWSGCWGEDASNAAVDAMLADGTAEVLRIGTGKDAS